MTADKNGEELLVHESDILIEKNEELFTEPMYAGYRNSLNNLCYSISGTFEGTIRMQRSLDKGITWGDVITFTGPVENNVFEPSNVPIYRLGVLAGDFVSGSCKCKMINW